MKKKSLLVLTLLFKQCHFDRALHDQFSLEFWMFVWFFIQPTLKSDLKEVQFTQNYLFWVKAPLIPWRCTKFQNSAAIKKHNKNKYSKFFPKFVIWHPVKMTWSGHKREISSNFCCCLLKKTTTLSKEQIMVRTLTISSPFILFQIKFRCIVDYLWHLLYA